MMKFKKETVEKIILGFIEHFKISNNYYDETCASGDGNLFEMSVFDCEQAGMPKHNIVVTLVSDKVIKIREFRHEIYPVWEIEIINNKGDITYELIDDGEEYEAIDYAYMRIPPNDSVFEFLKRLIELN